MLLAHGAVDRAPHDLKHRSTVRRARAAHLLGLCHVGAALPLLVDALRDPAAGGARRGDPGPRPPRGAQRRGRPCSPRSARTVPCPPARPRDALEKLGVGIADALRDGLLATSPTTRTVAAYLSGEGSFTRSIDLLAALAEDRRGPGRPRPRRPSRSAGWGAPLTSPCSWSGTQAHQPIELRRACAAALGDLGDPSAVDGLRALLADPDPRLAEIAATSLLRLGPVGLAARWTARPRTPRSRRARAVARLQGSLS